MSSPCLALILHLKFYPRHFQRPSLNFPLSLESEGFLEHSWKLRKGNWNNPWKLLAILQRTFTCARANKQKQTLQGRRLQSLLREFFPEIFSKKILQGGKISVLRKKGNALHKHRWEPSVHSNGITCSRMTYCFHMRSNVFIFLFKYLRINKRRGERREWTAQMV